MTSSCSTLNSSVMTGVGIGGVSGAVIGANTSSSSSKNKTMAMGAIIGALISGVIGYFIHKGINKRDEETRRKTLFNLDKYDVSAPQGFGANSVHGLSAPEIESEWIPTRVDGRKLIEGHKVWLITDEARWIPNAKVDSKSKK